MIRVKVRVTQSFDGCVEGDEAWVDHTPRVQGLISAGLFLVVAEVEATPEPDVELPGVAWPPPPVPEADDEEADDG
jgi:hypothetical protein